MEAGPQKAQNSQKDFLTPDDTNFFQLEGATCWLYSCSNQKSVYVFLKTAWIGAICGLIFFAGVAQNCAGQESRSGILPLDGRESLMMP
ncbi:hypothetical protein QQ054_16070 [Oscillatoria amoena NRMC-F 0135]|nr:hypothetical protein [Oscillatoria amoena NRMC-F 0135]